MVRCSFKHFSVFSQEPMALVRSSRVPMVRRSWRQFWEALWYLGACSLSAADGSNENSLRSACLYAEAPGSEAFAWLPVATTDTQT